MTRNVIIKILLALLAILLISRLARACPGFCKGNPDRYPSLGLNIDYTYTEGDYTTLQNRGIPFLVPMPTIYNANYQTIVAADVRYPVSNQETLYLRFGHAAHHTEPGLLGENGYTMGVGTRWYFKP